MIAATESQTESKAIVSLHEIRKSFGETEVLHGISLEVRRGETVCLIGPSGSGKSTLLRCVNHLEVPDGGLVLVDGDIIGYRQDGDVLVELGSRELAAQRAVMGMVFQSFNLFPHLTARENIVHAPRLVQKVSKAEADARAERLMARVGLADRLDSYPEELSGGQQLGVPQALRANAVALVVVPPVVQGHGDRWATAAGGFVRGFAGVAGDAGTDLARAVTGSSAGQQTATDFRESQASVPLAG
ncbi:ATP-binding cassette domain-containing protein [Streptomyces sp. NPDC050619]|uniref:amino acid ABC transporter ATP-binding protein n=1 Tax=Streptomyces sp. NPDC050619 TaxID=3157214 RepID=UPI0034178F69